MSVTKVRTIRECDIIIIKKLFQIRKDIRSTLIALLIKKQHTLSLIKLLIENHNVSLVFKQQNILTNSTKLLDHEPRFKTMYSFGSLTAYAIASGIMTSRFELSGFHSCKLQHTFPPYQLIPVQISI